MSRDPFRRDPFRRDPFRSSPQRVRPADISEAPPTARRRVVMPLCFGLILLYCIATVYWIFPRIVEHTDKKDRIRDHYGDEAGPLHPVDPTAYWFQYQSKEGLAGTKGTAASATDATTAVRTADEKEKHASIERLPRPSLEELRERSRRRPDCVPVPYPTFGQLPACHLESISPFHHRPRCRFENLVLRHDLIHASNRGGEDIHSVWGQGEDVEEVSYDPGALQSAPIDMDLQQEGRFEYLYYIKDALAAWQPINTTTSSPVCDKTVPGLTLFLKRYEYANLFHTLTDWWNTWNELDAFQRFFDVPVAGVVLLDAHPRGGLDDVWPTLFEKLDWVNNLPSSGSKDPTTTCFEHAVLVPAGYVNELFRPHAQVDFCPNTNLMAEFVNYFLDRFGLTHVHKIPKSVGIIDRKQYKAHPRKNLNALDRAIDNWEEVATKIRTTFLVDVRIFSFEDVPFAQQIQSIRECDVVIGNHGAGLTHLIFMDDDTHLIEFQHNNGNMFQILAEWKEGVTHRFLPRLQRNYIEDHYWEQHLRPLLHDIFNPP